MRLLVIAASWVAGTAVALHWGMPLAASASLLAASGAAALLLRLNGRTMLPALALAFALLGAMRAESLPLPSQPFQPWLAEGTVLVDGLVVDDPESRASALRFRFQVERLDTGSGWREVTGDLLATVQPSAELLGERGESYIRYGDRLLLSGSLDEAPEFQDFDYRDYLARQGIHALMYRADAELLEEGQGSAALALVYRLRGALGRSLESSLPEPQASLAQALLLGVREGIPPDVTQSFRDTGTSHLLAISGLHVAVVLGLSMAMAAALMGRRRNLYLLPPLGVIWLYAMLSGFAPSVERAAIMASVYLLAVALGRQRSAITAVAFAAALMVALDPNVLYDVSFQLSFVAIAGIIMMWRPIQTAMLLALGGLRLLAGWPGAVLGWVVAGVSVSLAAVLATFPILAFNFHYVALLSIPATLVALPALPLVLVSSLITAVAGLAAPALGQGAALVAWLPLSYLLGIVGLLDGIPRTVVQLGDVSAVLGWTYYGGPFLALLLVWVGPRRVRAALRRLRIADTRPSRRTPVPVGAVRGAALLSLAAAVVLIWTANASLPDGRLRVSLLDVGQGEAIFIQTPGGGQVLVDGGRDPRLLLQALGERMPFWDGTLDMVVLTHPHEDHLAGLVEVVRRYRVDVVMDSAHAQESQVAAAWRAAVEREGATTILASHGQVVTLEEGITLEVLNPPRPLMGGTASDVNNNSTVLRLSHGRVSFLLTGDLELEGELSLLDRGVDVRSTVLKVAHHGSGTSSSADFLSQVRPALVLVSAAPDSPDGLPGHEVMARLADAAGDSARVFATARHGDITLISDGRSVEVQTDRQ